MCLKKMAALLGIMLLCICVSAKPVKTKKTPPVKNEKDSTAVLKTNDSSSQSSTALPVTGAKQSTKKIVLCISRAGLNAGQNQARDSWLSPILETYYYFKLSFSEQIKIIPRKNFSKSLQKPDPYGTVIPESDLITGVKRAQGEYLLIHTYAIDAGTNDISYSMKIIDVGTNKPVLTYTQKFPASELNNKLDESAQSIFDNFKITLSKEPAGLVKRPVLFSNLQNVKDFGEAIVTAEADSSFQSATGKLTGIINKESLSALAVFKLASIFSELQDYDQAAQNLSRLIMRNGFDVPAFYIEASRFFRYCQLYHNAQRMVALAENKSINSPALSFEKELVLGKGTYTPEADTLIKQALNDDPDNSDALLFLSYQYRENGSYEKALSVVNRLLDETVVSGAVYLAKARILMSMYKYDDALQSLASARTLTPRDSTIPALCGDAYFAKKDYASALANYGQAFAKMPKNMELLLKISESHRASGNLQMALDVLNKNKRTFSEENTAIMRQTGLIFYSMGDSSKARKILESCMEKNPSDADVFIALGEIYATGGNREKAIEMYTSAAALVKDKLPIEFSIGKIYLSGNDLANAENRFLSIYQKKPDYPSINKYLGMIYIRKSQYKLALTHFLNERKYSGDDEELQQSIAQLYVTTADLAEAEKEAKKLIELNPKNAAGYLLLAEVALRQKKASDADRYIAEAEGIGVVKPAVYKDIAKIFTEAGLYTKAIESYQKYFTHETADAQTLIELSRLYAQTKQDTMVAQTYLRIYACDNKNYLEYCAKAGNTFFRLDMKPQAYDAFIKYTEKAGFSNNEVTYNLALIELDKKNYSQVLKLVSSLKETKSAQQQISHLFALAYYNLGKFNEALPYIKQTLINNPQDPVSVEMLATSYEKLGFMDGAIENYQKFLKLRKTEKHQEYAFHAAALLENAKRDKEAIAQYVQNIAAYPEDISNYEHLSALYAANKNYAFAISTFEKMMKLPSVPYEYQKKLADLYFKTGNRELAIATYESYLKNKNNDSEAWFLLGMIYYDSKMYDKALNPLSSAYDLAPDRYECMLALSYTYMLTNNTENAVRILRQSLQNNAKDKESLLLLTECYTMAKDTLNLIDILEKRSTLEPASFDINFQLGGLYIHTGNIENAIKSYERAKRSRPDDERTRHILSELYKKKL